MCPTASTSAITPLSAGCYRWRDAGVGMTVFFFSSRRRHTRCLSDWSSDVCSSDLKGEELVPMMPWYRGFKGPIEPTEKPGRCKVTGIIKALEDNVVEITELPVGMWTQEMKEFLEKEVMGTDKGPGIVKDYVEHHLESTVH